MPNRLQTITTATLLSIMASPAMAYTTTSTIGSKGGWDDINRSSTTTAVIDTSDFTTDNALSTGTVATALTNAFSTWDSVAGANTLSINIKNDNGGNYDVVDGPGATADNGADYKYADITVGGWLSGSWFSDAFGSTDILAVTLSGRVGRGKNATWFADVYFNDAYNWTADASGGIDIETVALHEFGHALGLGHEDDVPSVMATYYGGVQRDLFQDDIDGITSLYSDGGGGDGGGGKPDKPRGGPKRLTLDGLDTDLYLSGITYANLSAVPEPSSLALLGLGGLLIANRRRRA